MPEESADQQPLPQPEPPSTAVTPENIISQGMEPEKQSKHDAAELKAQETKPMLNEQEWGEILGLGNKSFLDLNPDELARLQDLTKKGKELMGDDFDSQLRTKKAEAQRKKDEQGVARSEKLNQELSRVAAAFGKKARAIMRGFEEKTSEGQKEMDSKEAAFRQQLKEAREADGDTAQVLKEALNNPKMAGIKAELAWMDLLSGKPVKGVDPDLIRRVSDLHKDAISRIMTDPQKYEQDLQRFKAEFHKSRGIDLGDNPKANTI